MKDSRMRANGASKAGAESTTSFSAFSLICPPQGTPCRHAVRASTVRATGRRSVSPASGPEENGRAIFAHIPGRTTRPPATLTVGG
jgi:hypothetical protein